MQQPNELLFAPEPTRELGLDNAAENLELEVKFHAREFVQNTLSPDDASLKERSLAPLLARPTHYVEQVNNQFFTRIIDTFLSENDEEAWQHFKQTPFATFSEEMLLLLNEAEFKRLRAELTAYLSLNQERFRQNVDERLSENGQIAWNDRYQFATREKRSLDQIREGGIRIELDEKAISAIKQAAASQDSHRPILEQLKNEKMVTINGFPNSKVSLLVHDYMDHFGTFELLKETGILDRYQRFFDRVGNPEKTDIFKREGEAISSIAFGVRLFQTQELGFVPLISTGDIGKIMNDHLSMGRLRERHLEALKIIHSIQPNSREWLSLGFVYSNYVVELDEQRRKHGKIKTKDLETGQIEGELDECDPDYLSLFIETHHQLLQPRNKHRDKLYRFHLVLEDILQRVADDDLSSDKLTCAVTPGLIDSYDFSKTSIRGERMKWMLTNYGFTATKETMV